MKKIALVLMALLFGSEAFAHFGVVKTSNSVVEEAKDAKIIVDFEFTHPFMQAFMNLEKPEETGVFINGKKELFTNLQVHKKGGLDTYQANYELKEPAMYSFYMIPKPYFEPAENKFIRHITKTIVNAYGYGEGWDKPLSLKAEILPLTRPYALYKGSVFSGVVYYKGKRAKNIIVEVEYYNTQGLKAPNEDFITQEVKTNENGEFSFALPFAGWWGFAALIDDDETIKKDNKTYPVELGAVLWVETKE
ncbi:DUF4198 domain-containing protein [Campylobacter sp. MIT 12-5580]|uniref:DUF4198 domain-containing protein n=1 Tax=Campylobacter sp. MIT 12-5580 TaxID=2040651 RepID=UPI0010F8660F|nr:DUF4198 domain-containing protein [Campylobacter sp. MIT 12-5580]TKX29655.1 DUF4198 domain-containing protein [Campylobacter sp. MIT 12-5580]